MDKTMDEEEFDLPSPLNTSLQEFMNGNLDMSGVFQLGENFLGDSFDGEGPENDRGQKVGVDDFTLLKVIGKGSYGKVMQVRKRDSSEILAMKILKRSHIEKRNQVEHTKAERRIMEFIRHPFIVHLRYAFQNSEKLYFVLDYCPGGELFFHLDRERMFSEQKTKFYAAQILLALEHLHKYKIIYRDLKPENVLIDPVGNIKLTDFGLSKENIEWNGKTRTICGTPEYLAPEVFSPQGYGKAVDWWSFGSLIYEMLRGEPPFYSQNREELFQNIRHGQVKYPKPFFTPTIIDLLDRLLVRDPNKRLGSGPRDAEEIKEHEWFSDIDWDKILRCEIEPPFKPIIGSMSETNYITSDFTSMPVVDSIGSASVKLGQSKWSGWTFDGQ